MTPLATTVLAWLALLALIGIAYAWRDWRN